jgi:1,2-diacylglycerol 3-alpha-glucosyltransferase
MGWAGVYCAKTNDLPLLSTFHTPLSEYVPYLFGQRNRLVYLGKRLAWSYCRAHYNLYDEIIAPSETIKNLLRARRIRKRIAVLPTGIQLKKFDRVKRSKEVRKRFGIDGEFILHAGRISREKNIETVIHALPLLLKHHPGLELVITSKGPWLGQVKKEVQKLGLEDSIIFTGYVSDDDLIRLYKEAELSVIASEAETQGLVIIEAMACGTPVVGSDYLAIPETIKNGKNGLLFKLHDEHDLAEKAGKILGSGVLRKKLSKGARATSKQNTIEKRTEELVDIYRQNIG